MGWDWVSLDAYGANSLYTSKLIKNINEYFELMFVCTVEENRRSKKCNISLTERCGYNSQDNTRKETNTKN